MSRGLDETDGPNFVLAAAEIRKQLDALGEELGKPMTLSIAVPSKPVDMIVYNKTEVTKGLDEYVDYWNLMVREMTVRRTKTDFRRTISSTDETLSLAIMQANRLLLILWPSILASESLSTSSTSAILCTPSGSSRT
jgi:hypothetical protein